MAQHFVLEFCDAFTVLFCERETRLPTLPSVSSMVKIAFAVHFHE